MIETLQNVKAHFEELKTRNCSVSPLLDSAMDRASLSAMALVDNQRKENLNLKVFDSFSDFLENIQNAPSPSSCRAVIPSLMTSNHRVAADVQRHKDRTSVILIDSFPVEKAKAHLLAVKDQISAALPKQVYISLIALGTQASDAGCGIFAYSAALKLHANQELFQSMHKKHLKGLQIAPTLTKWSSGNKKINLLDGNPLLPKGFIKHTESSTRLKSWLTAHPDEKNLQHGQTLMERFVEHRVERSDWEKQLNFSASIEDKRIALLSRTISGLENKSPSQEISAALEQFQHHVPDLGGMLKEAKPQVYGQVSRLPYVPSDGNVSD